MSQIQNFGIKGCELFDEDLMRAIESDNLTLFSDLLSDKVQSNINEEIVSANHSNLLHICLSTPGKEQFAQELLRLPTLNPNISHRILKVFPLHLATSAGNEYLVESLLRLGADVNAKREDGSTALHIACQRSSANWISSGTERETLRTSYINIVRHLLQVPTIDIEAETNLGLTPLFLAAEKGSEPVIQALLTKGASVLVTVDDESIEEILSRRFPHLKIDSNRIKRDSNESLLFKALYQESLNPGVFFSTLNSFSAHSSINFESDNGAYTFLQYAADLGFVSIVEFLLKEHVNPNAMSPNYKMPPLLLAAHHGYYKVLQAFKNHSQNVDFNITDGFKGENIFHKIIKKESKAYVNFEERDYEKCLGILLDSGFRARIQISINSVDHLGNTPLHVAGQLSQDDVVRKLLRAEAHIGIKNRRGETPILHISPIVMEEYLDECLSGEGLVSDERFKIIFKYTFLGPPIVTKEESLLRPEGFPPDPYKFDLPETEPLWYMSQLPSHRPLLVHPVITSFLCMKWRKIRPYFYLNSAFYTIFVGVLTAYMILLNENNQSSLVVLRPIGTLFLLLLSLREIFQAIVSFRRYIFSFENLIEISLICTTFYVFYSSDSSTSIRECSAAVLLLSWAEMILLFGRHPKVSIFVSMFSRVSQKFFLFLSWYISFILAFGLAFSILFRVPESINDSNSLPSLPVEEKEPVNPYFSSTGKTLFKTIVMSLTGEMEFESIDFGVDGSFAKFIFILYIFFIMLVLVNLLNGLAVSDISAIQKEAEILAHVSRIELITYAESMLLGDPFMFLTNWPSWGRKLPSCSFLNRCSVLQRVLNRIGDAGNFLLFNGRLVNKQAIFYPNYSRKEKSKNQSSKLLVDQNILESAKLRLIQHEEDLRSTQSFKLEQIEKSLKLLSDQQNFIIEKIINLSK